MIEAPDLQRIVSPRVVPERRTARRPKPQVAVSPLSVLVLPVSAASLVLGLQVVLEV
jgi:hypothetical protein